MSLPSFKLSKAGGHWWAEGKLPSGRPFRKDCGPASSSRDRAQGQAEQLVAQLVRVSNAGKARWKVKPARSSPVIPASSAPASSSPEPELEQPELEQPAPAAAPPRQSNDEIRAKLLHLGDVGPGPSSSSSSSSVHPDEVIPPGGRREEEPEPLDDEAGEAIADVLATGLTTGLVWLANRPLKNRKPPMVGEPHEKGLEWFQAGAKYNLKKIVGEKTTMTPTQKMFAGAAIIVTTVWMNAEPIDGAAAPEQPREAAAPAAPPATPQPAAAGEAAAGAANANGSPSSPASTSTALTVTSALGSFGVGKATAN